MNTSPRILVSSCLIGKKCSYDGLDRFSEKVSGLCARYGCVDVCPEVAGGLPIPREAHEIVGGDGEDVLAGRCRVMGISGEDVSSQFIKGAERALEKAVQSGALIAILKARSPSCGRGKIYAGSFDRKLKEGNGVAAALLGQNGIPVFSEEETEAAEEKLLAIIKKNNGRRR